MDVFNFKGVFFHVLQAIDVSRCDCVSSSGLISIISGHGGLEQIDAGYCLSVSSYPNLWCLI